MTKNHNPKDLPVSTLDAFVALTLTIMLKEPELLEAFKKRNEFEGRSAIKELKEKKDVWKIDLKL